MRSISYLDNHDIDQDDYVIERYHNLLRRENGGRLTEIQQSLLDLLSESSQEFSVRNL